MLDEPRPGKPRTISDARIEKLIATTLNELPKGSTHWSTRQMTAKLKLSQSTVAGVWRAFGLQPHRVETFKLSTDPLFIEKVRDIVGRTVVRHAQRKADQARNASQHGRYPSGSWIRSPHISMHKPFSKEGCIIFVKTGCLLGK